MKKRYIALSTLLFLAILLGNRRIASACDACKAQQPKFLQGITHGPGPTSNWDYVVVSIMVVITVYSLYATVKCLVKPAEKAHDSIKHIIFKG